MNIAVINGPNLNLLGLRDPNQYGSLTLEAINQLLVTTYPNVTFSFFQSNHEGVLVDYIQTLDVDGIIINPAAYTHSSIAIRDALEIKSCPIVEVHLSDLSKREPFRQINYIRDVVTHHISGKKEQSYLEAVEFLLSKR